MLPFGHVGFSYAIALLLETIHEIIRRNKKDHIVSREQLDDEEHASSIINYLLFSITIFLPDVFDKTVSQIMVHSGRAYGHTLLFVFTTSLITFFITRRNKQITFTVFLGSFIHLWLDLDNGGFVPFFWPFIPYFFPTSEPWTVQRLLYIYLTSPPPSEIIGFILTVTLLWIKRKDIMYHLRYQNPIFRRMHDHVTLKSKIIEE